MVCLDLCPSKHRLINIDDVANHPEVYLVKLAPPAVLEVAHPLTVAIRVGYIHDESHEIVSVDHTTMAPVPLYLLGLVAGGTKPFYDLQDSFCQPSGGNLATIVKLQRQQDFEAPPVVAHR